LFVDIIKALFLHVIFCGLSKILCQQVAKIFTKLLDASGLLIRYYTHQYLLLLLLCKSLVCLSRFNAWLCLAHYYTH